MSSTTSATSALDDFEEDTLECKQSEMMIASECIVQSSEQLEEHVVMNLDDIESECILPLEPDDGTIFIEETREIEIDELNAKDLVHVKPEAIFIKQEIDPSNSIEGLEENVDKPDNTSSTEQFINDSISFILLRKWSDDDSTTNPEQSFNKRQDISGADVSINTKTFQEKFDVNTCLDAAVNDLECVSATNYDKSQHRPVSLLEKCLTEKPTKNVKITQQHTKKINLIQSPKKVTITSPKNGKKLKLTPLHKVNINGKRKKINETQSTTDQCESTDQSTNFEENRMDSNLNEDLMLIKTGTVQCYRCVAFMDCENLSSHLKTIHNVTNTKEGASYRTELAILRNLSQPPSLECILCGDKFICFISLNVHIEVRHGICRICGVRLDSLKESKHRNLHYRCVYIFKCTTCHEDFESYTSFHSEYHQSKHKLENSRCCEKIQRIRDFECPYCLYQTREPKSLQFHLKLHELKHCNECQYLYVPTLRHIGNVNLKTCLKCTPEFATLIYNISTLTNLPCLFCNAVLYDGIMMYEHIKSQHQCCIYCCKDFQTIANLNRHKRTCKSLPGYQCGICLSSCQTLEEINQHMAEFHTTKQAKFIRVIKDEMIIDQILSNTQCGYCLQYTLVDEPLEIHFMRDHQIKKCTCCNTNLTFDTDLCKICQQINDATNIQEFTVL